MLNRSASLAMSTSVLKALPGKLDIKRHSLYISFCEPTCLHEVILVQYQTICLSLSHKHTHTHTHAVCLFCGRCYNYDPCSIDMLTMWLHIQIVGRRKYTSAKRNFARGIKVGPKCSQKSVPRHTHVCKKNN